MMDNLCNFSAAGLVYPASALCLWQVFHLGLRSAFVHSLPASLLPAGGRVGSAGRVGRVGSACCVSFPNYFLPAPKPPGITSVTARESTKTPQLDKVLLSQVN